jgi:hypothetical protein
MTPPINSRWTRRTLALALVAAVLAGCGSMPLTRPGQTFRPTPSPGPTFDEERTGFDGLVVDEDGNPIEGVHLDVTIFGRTGSAATTAEGTFFDRGNLGEFTITAELEGFITEEVTIVVVPNEIVEVEIVLVADGD